MCDGVLNMPLLKNKAGAKCAKRTLDAATWNVNLLYVFWNTSMILANFWLRRNVRFENLLISFVKQHFRPSLLKFDWLFLFGFFLVGYMLPLIFKQIKKLYICDFGSQFRSIFRTLSNIQDGGFYKISYWLFVFDYFCKKLHLRCLTGFWISLWHQ